MGQDTDGPVHGRKSGRTGEETCRLLASRSHQTVLLTNRGYSSVIGRGFVHHDFGFFRDLAGLIVHRENKRTPSIRAAVSLNGQYFAMAESP